MTTIQYIFMIMAGAILFATVAVVVARLIVVAYRFVSKLFNSKEN